MLILSLWPALYIQICFINILYLTIGTLLLFTYGSANCLKAKKLSVTKDASSNQPKKAVVEHSIRLSYHNDLPKSEGSDETTPKIVSKHHPGTLFISPDQTQSGVIGSKNLLPSKYTSKLCREAEKVIRKSLIVGSEKLTEDKTQVSVPSMDFTQMTAESEENDKQSSKTLTESTMKESKNILKHDKASDEALTQNVSLSQTLDVKQVKVQQPSEGEESGSNGQSAAAISTTDDRKQDSITVDTS
ncbi:Uncharacterized protein BM_BM8978 [Brugia malayi]|uniref:Bm8978 n=2 Tax=Brugia TaxID=6278 RepID=A0A0K0JXN6_BRUMA|nr:Uncharacterized protein BM_BM8978 [Brugia malayi]CDQ04446.1 Bm8978 [Brugia malayi]VDO34366.1 unnamed protein product [Brugia timori]VIO90682.1 Uncharacterized protein BM_BM8978 [Brugia malayi]